MNIDWTAVATGAASFMVLLVIKILIDFRLGALIVKNLHWFPVRNWFRDKPPKLAGTWEQIWGAGGSESFSDVATRHDHTVIKQFGNYCYTEFFSNKVRYALFGHINQNYIVGDWYAVEDPLGYFGAFQLEIVDSNTIDGKWIGHSKTTKKIRSDNFTATRVGP